MNKKEEIILNEIIKYYKKNMAMPSIRYLQYFFNYKSTNTIFKYLKSLETKGYLQRNSKNKVIINDCSLYKNKNLKQIRVINRKDNYVHIFLKKKNNYIAYQVNNNNLDCLGLMKNDIIIVQLNSKMHNNDIGLFIIDNKYQIKKYNYHDGFYILSSENEIILNKVNLVGKVIIIERKVKKL